MKNLQELSSIYLEHADALYSYGCKLTADKETVKDCIHDVFLHLYEKDNLLEINNIRLFLIISLRNSILNKLKKAAPVPLDDLPFEYDLPDEAQSDDIYIEQERQSNLKAYINDALKILTDRQREVIYLHYIEELDYQQISKVLGLSYQTLRNTVSQGLKLLREKLGTPPTAFFSWLLIVMKGK